MTNSTRRVLVVDTDFPDLEVERESGSAADLDFTVLDKGQSVDDLSAKVRQSITALLMQWDTINAQVIDQFPSLRVIGRLGLGLDQVDVEAATERGVAVVNSGDYATEEVSLHAIALMLAVVRRIPRSDRAIRDGGWFNPDDFAGVPRLSHLTLGLVGLGRIGNRVAEIASTLGMSVVAYDPFAHDADIEMVPNLSDLLGRSDVLSLHAPLTPDTKGVIGLPQLLALKPGAVLINTSRGGLVDLDAVLTALREGHLSGAGLDVFEEEPLPAGHPLTREERVVLTPHAAYYSDVGARDARRRPVQGIAAVLSGRRPLNQVNDPKNPR